MKEVCPHLFTKQCSSCSEAPTPLDTQAFGSCTEPSRQSAQAPPKPHPEPSSPSATVSAESSVPEWHEGHAWLPGFSVAGLFLLMLKKHQAASQYDASRKTTHTLSCLLSPTEKLGFRDTGMSFLAAAVRGALSSCLCQCARPYRLSPCSVSSAGCFWDTRCTAMAHFPNS